MGCEQTREVAAELALGIADGAERARALRHLAECPDCRRAVEELSMVTDELLLLAPEHEPPPGFEARVLRRMEAREPARRRPPLRLRARRLLAPVTAAAAAAAVAVGLVLGATSDERRDAQHYRSVLAAANGTSFVAAKLHDTAGVPAGIVYGYEGRSSWIYVGLYADHRDTRYRVELALTSGRRLPLPAMRLDPATGSAGQAIPVDLSTVSGVRLVGSERGDVLVARLPRD
jgi:hypothetical protein